MSQIRIGVNVDASKPVHLDLEIIASKELFPQ